MSDNRFRIITREPPKYIHVTCSYQGDSWTLQFPDTITLEEIHQYLSEHYNVPRDGIRTINAKGSPWQLEIYDGCAFTFMDDESFHRAFMEPPVELYGCPNAKNVPGVLPDCILTAFDDFESFEL